MLAIQYTSTHKHVHYIYITKYQIVENLLRASKQSLIYRQVCFVDATLSGLSKQVKILVLINFVYLISSDMFIQRTIK